MGSEFAPSNSRRAIFKRSLRDSRASGPGAWLGPDAPDISPPSTGSVIPIVGLGKEEAAVETGMASLGISAECALVAGVADPALPMATADGKCGDPVLLMRRALPDILNACQRRHKPLDAPIPEHAERWPSGRRRSPGK